MGNIADYPVNLTGDQPNNRPLVSIPKNNNIFLSKLL